MAMGIFEAKKQLSSSSVIWNKISNQALIKVSGWKFYKPNGLNL